MVSAANATTQLIFYSYTQSSNLLRGRSRSKGLRVNTESRFLFLLLVLGDHSRKNRLKKLGLIRKSCPDKWWVSFWGLRRNKHFDKREEEIKE